MRLLIFEQLDHLRRFAAVPFVIIACMQASAQQAPGAEGARGEPMRLDSVGLVIGMPGLLPNLRGTLNITAKTLSFNTSKTSAEIERSMITSVAAGDESIEIGGTMFSMVRMALPKGSGLAVAALAHKKVGWLSVEYRNAANEYHGVVFALRPKDIALVQRELGAGLAAVDAPTTVPAACSADQVRKGSVRLAPIQAGDAALLPDEYRVLVYERLIQQLQTDKQQLAVYRDGDRDPAAQCAEFYVSLKVKSFKKGSQVLRASTGPLGLFMGTTSLSYHLTARTPDGTAVIDKDMKSSERKDTDSLNVTVVMGKAIAGDLRKAEKRLRTSPTP
jgi:hypothetical protein